METLVEDYQCHPPVQSLRDGRSLRFSPGSTPKAWHVPPTVAPNSGGASVSAADAPHPAVKGTDGAQAGEADSQDVQTGGFGDGRRRQARGDVDRREARRAARRL